MKLNVLGKTITITDKNARAYEKNERIFSRRYHKNKNEMDNIIARMAEGDLSTFMNQHIEREARACYGDIFYEEA